VYIYFEYQSSKVVRKYANLVSDSIKFFIAVKADYTYCSWSHIVKTGRYFNTTRKEQKKIFNNVIVDQTLKIMLGTRIIE
jgi:hypothetical protein